MPEDGYSVQIQSADGQYIGDRIPLKQGKFVETLPLRKNKTTPFQVFLIDKNQNPVPTFPDKFEITHGISISGAPIPRNIGVVYSKMQLLGKLAYKEHCEVYFTAGSTLPLEHTENFKTLVEVKAGVPNELPIKVYEGDSPDIAFNRILTTLNIDGAALPHNLPEGSDIEITISINESREFGVEAYIPDLDISIDARVAMYEEKITGAQIEDKIENLWQAYSKVKDSMPTRQQNELERRIENIEISSSAKTLDEDARNLIIRDSNDVLRELYKVEEDSAHGKLVSEARHEIQSLRELLSEEEIDNSDSFLQQLEAIEAEVDECNRTENKAGMERCMERLGALAMTVFVRLPGFWAALLRDLAPRAAEASDPAQFMHLCMQGSDALENNDMDQLQRICVELWNLLPHEAGETFGAGFSGITR